MLDVTPKVAAQAILIIIDDFQQLLLGQGGCAGLEVVFEVNGAVELVNLGDIDLGGTSWPKDIDAEKDVTIAELKAAAVKAIQDAAKKAGQVRRARGSS